VTPFEAKASEVAGALAGRAVSIVCVDEAAWRSLGAQAGFDPAQAWALAPFHWDSGAGRPVPDGYARFSPRACRYGDAFWSRPSEHGAKICRYGTTTEWRMRRVQKPTKRRVRVKVDGKLVWRVVTRKATVVVREPVKVPLYSECDDWASKLVAVHVLSHEAVHLSGFHGEASAECLAVQVDAYVATALGADEGFARAMAREFWRDHYRPRSDAYRSRDCRDGGRLDLFPERAGWPTPDAYPADLAARISTLETSLGTAGGAP